MEKVILDLVRSLEDMVLWANIKDGSPSQQLHDDAFKAIENAKSLNK